MFHFAIRLHYLKKALREWNDVTFGDVHANMCNVEASV